jgi:hypothetical protein
MKRISYVIAVGMLLTACAGVVIPSLLNRTLLIHPDKPALVYPYCAKYKWWNGKCKDRKVDEYDLNDPTARALLKNFECHHSSRDF